MPETFANDYTTTLSAGILSSDTTITVVDAVPAALTGSFRIRIGDELILVGSASGTTFSSCTRGVEGTTAVAHSSGDDVANVLTVAGLAALAPTVPVGNYLGDAYPASPGAEDEEFEGTADTLPTDWAWVSAAPSFRLNSDYPSLFVIDRAANDSTERKLRKSNFTMDATSGLWVKMGIDYKYGDTGQFEFMIYDSASSTGYGFGIHNGYVPIARQSTSGGAPVNRGTGRQYSQAARWTYLGVKRVSNTWETWYSDDGVNWTLIQTIDTLAFTVARLELRWSGGAVGYAASARVDWIRYRTDNNFPKP